MGKGILIGILLHGFQILIFVLALVIVPMLPSKQQASLAYLPVIVPFWAGITQLMYMIPAILIFRRRGQTDVAKGITIVAAIGFLLNSSCLGMLYMGSWK